MGQALRRLHRVTGPRFGDLLDDGPRRATAWDHVAARAGELVTQYLRTGGPARLAERGTISVEAGPAGDEAEAVYLQGLSVRTPNGTVLVRRADAVIRAGERVLIQGESGTGKSTLFRAMAGAWPWGAGRIRLPEVCGNLTFGGPKRNRLFMAASQSIYALTVNTQGAGPA